MVRLTEVGKADVGLSYLSIETGTALILVAPDHLDEIFLTGELRVGSPYPLVKILVLSHILFRL